jgi:putative molybdopterin biosynthesis protein
VVVTVAQIEEGLAVARGNPRRIRKVAHLAGKSVRFINRDQTAGARRLLDRLLAAEHVEARQIEGYDRVAAGHLEAAAAVATGAADAAVVTCGSALALGLDFIPLASERFDLVIPKDALGDPRVSRLIETLASGEFRRELASIGGYGTRKAGSIAAELGSA